MKSFIIASVLISLAVLSVKAEDDFEIDWTKVKGNYVSPKIVNEPTTINVPEARIVGGKPAKRHQFPYQVGLAVSYDGKLSWCGGSLISENYVLTAAHCVDENGVGIVFLGAHNIRYSREYGQKRMRVHAKNYILHPGYNPKTLSNDIALIKLPEPVTLNSQIKLIALPKANIKTVDRSTIASGWGLVSDSITSAPSELRYVTLNTISLLECKIYFRSAIRDTHVCADSSSGKAICDGDSGGPLVVEEDGVTTIIGLSSFSSARGCKSGRPSVFTKVSSYLDWIEENSDVKL